MLTIADVDLQELEGSKGKEWKGVLSFVGERQEWTLNKTNGICLREMFGRVPYKWVGRRFAIFASATGGMNGEPCIRIWGSPELTEDLVVTIELPRKKPFKMTMHAMGDERSLRAAGQRAAARLEAVQGGQRGDVLGDRCIELMKLMGTSKDIAELESVEADYRLETFNMRETTTLEKALERRRAQLNAAVIT